MSSWNMAGLLPRLANRSLLSCASMLLLGKKGRGRSEREEEEE